MDDFNQNNWNDERIEPNASNYYNATQPNQFDQPTSQGKGMAIASLILGILSLLCCCIGIGLIFAIIGLILSIICIRKCDNAYKGVCIAAIVTSSLGLLSGIYWVLSMVYTLSIIDWSQVDINDMQKTEEYFRSLEESLQYFKLF